MRRPVIRTMDTRNHIVMPNTIVKLMDLKPNETKFKTLVDADNGQIIFQIVPPQSCDICGSTENLKALKFNLFVCKECIENAPPAKGWIEEFEEKEEKGNEK